MTAASNTKKKSTEDKEEIEEATAGLADVEEISADTAEAALRASHDGKHVFVLLLTGFGKNYWRTAARPRQRRTYHVTPRTNRKTRAGATWYSWQ